MPSVIIGLTGAFGSGCTTAALELRDARGYRYVRLSDVIRDTWREKGGGNEPSRAELQRIGDQLRQEKGPAALVDLAIEKVSGGSMTTG